MTIDETLTEIAAKHLGLETLEARNSDRLDFSEQGVGSIKDALAAAYAAGQTERDAFRRDAWLYGCVEKRFATLKSADAVKVLQLLGLPEWPYMSLASIVIEVEMGAQPTEAAHG